MNTILLSIKLFIAEYELAILRLLYVGTGIEQVNNDRWWETGFLLLEWEVADKKGEEARTFHVVMD